MEIATLIMGIVAGGASLVKDLLATDWTNDAEAVKQMHARAEEFFQFVGDGRQLFKDMQARRDALQADIDKAKAERPQG